MIIIGIDPDTSKSGVGVMQTFDASNAKKIIDLKNLDYFELFDYLTDISSMHDNNVLVVVEKGEDNKHLFNAEATYHKTNGNAKQKRFAAFQTAAKTGKNFQVSDMIIQFCKRNKIKYETYVPKIPKWNHKFVKALFNLKQKTTNQEQRDALRCIAKKI